MTAPKNVLFITADQWRGDSLSALGHPCVQTPNLDRLAADGVLFRNHFTQATPCGPSRASIHTGMYLQNHRSVINGTPLDARHSNVALEARKAGYDPVLFGYTDTSLDPRTLEPGDPALRTYEGVLPGMTPVVPMDDDQLPWRSHLRAKGYDISDAYYDVFRPKPDVPGAAERGPTFAPARYAAEDSNTAFLTDAALSYIAVRHDRPWFVHISYWAPHPPFVVPEPYHAMYDPADVPAPLRAATLDAEAAQHPWLTHYLSHQKGSGFTFGSTSNDHGRLSERDLRQMRATYYGMITEVDAQIGRLIDYLKKSGAYERTLIVFTSDHGEQLGDHWMLAKYGYFDQAFHVPMLVHDPEPAAEPSRGRIVEAFSENIDVMPTILDWLDLAPPRQCDGRSVLPFCRGATPKDWRQEAHWEFDFRDIETREYETAFGLRSDQCTLAVIRDRRYKYVHFAAMPALFFDLQEDPMELHDRAGDPAYQSLVLDYAQKMLSWRMAHDDYALTHQLLTPDGVVEQYGRG